MIEEQLVSSWLPGAAWERDGEKSRSPLPGVHATLAPGRCLDATLLLSVEKRHARLYNATPLTAPAASISLPQILGYLILDNRDPFMPPPGGGDDPEVSIYNLYGYRRKL